jgi:hypothetical protein
VRSASINRDFHFPFRVKTPTKPECSANGEFSSPGHNRSYPNYSDGQIRDPAHGYLEEAVFSELISGLCFET